MCVRGSLSLLLLASCLPRCLPLASRKGEVTVVSLQTHNLTTVTSYVEAAGAVIPRMDQVTLCARFKIRQYSEASTILSYYSEGVDNELFISVDGVKGYVTFLCCDHKVSEEAFLAPVSLFVWHHLCVAANFTQLQAHVLLDGQMANISLVMKLKNTSSEALYVREGGHLVIGQDLDTQDGGFSLNQALVGDVADWLLFNVSLSLDEMKDYVACGVLSRSLQPVLQFDESMMGLELRGPSFKYKTTIEEVCTELIHDQMIMFPMRMEFEAGATWCRTLGGVLALPSTSQENSDIINHFAGFQNQCKSIWNTFFWLGVKWNTTSEEWIKLSDSTKITWETFHPIFTPALSSCECAGAAITIYNLLWFCIPCNLLNCPLCYFKKSPTFRLKGLCKISQFDRLFTLKGINLKNPELIGYYRSRIIFDDESWKMETTVNERNASATMLTPKPGLPLGRHTWRISNDDCGTTERVLLLTVCKTHEYTCDDGTCVGRARRCDHTPDCPDNSDERTCSFISLPHGYSNELPPSSATPATPLQLFVDLEITSVKEFDLAGFKVGLNIIHHVKWRDSRISFNNLKEAFFSNTDKGTQVWLPKFTVTASNRSPADVTQVKESLWVNREHQPQPDDDTTPQEDEVYDGGNNTLLLATQYTVTFSCQFYLAKYPFDSQRCSLHFQLPHAGNSVTYVIEAVKFEGDRVLLEYEVVGVWASTHFSDQWPILKMEVEFRNQRGYYIGNAFLPSLLLSIVCYLSFCFAIDDFQDRVMVSLTSLLVLTSLLTQTNQSIPKTAYLKLIDVWYVVLICLDFLIIVVLVGIESLRRRVKPSAVSVAGSQVMVKSYGSGREVLERQEQPKDSMIWKKGMVQQLENKYPSITHAGEDKARKLNQISLLVFPIVIMCFLGVFFYRAFINESR